MPHRARVLLVNPWIYDLAAHNSWCEPLGLLSIGAVLRRAGYGVSMVDCLSGATTRPRPDGSGRFAKIRLPKPALLRHVPRHFGRYGISAAELSERLSRVETPEVILVTSSMTYWYPGVMAVIARLKARWPGVPVVLGGTYASLCADHACLHSGADRVVVGEGETGIVKILEAVLQEKDRIEGSETGPLRETPVHRPDPPELDALPMTAHELRWAERVPEPYIAVETSRGCPFHCTYCASHTLHPGFRRRPMEAVVDEIEHYRRRRGVRHVAFYDDALLFEAEAHAVPILEEILRRRLDCTFHTPNGIHAREIGTDLAGLLYRAGFRTLRLGLETTDPERQLRTGGKIDSDAFARAAEALQAAGFTAKHLGAYILCGLPGQSEREIAETIRFAHRRGTQARIAEFSPLPHTKEGSRFDPDNAEDPLCHNNIAGPAHVFDDPWGTMERLKRLAREGNRQLLAGTK